MKNGLPTFTLVLLLAAALEAAPRLPYADAVRRAADRHGVEEALIRAVIQAESAFDPQAVSHKGAQGLMQLLVPTARQYAPGVSGRRLRRDPALNIDIGTRHLKTLQRQVDQRYPHLRGFERLRLVAAAYNAGWGRVLAAGGRVPAIAETRTYVRRVEANYRLYGGRQRDLPARPAATAQAPRPNPATERLKLWFGLGVLLALQALAGATHLLALSQPAHRAIPPFPGRSS